MDDLVSRRWMVREEELDDEQFKIRALRPDNYLIEGCAGSGKTILALHKAKEIQESGDTYLLIIYTLTLKTFIQDGITSLGLDPDRVCIFDRIDKLGYGNADYIIVDEVQDFSREQIRKLVGMADKNFIFFGDDAQQLYTKGTSLKSLKTITGIVETNHRRLDNNYRLPIQVAKYAQYVATHPDQIVSRCVKTEGDKPLVLEFINFTSEIKYIADIIENEGWTDVGILVDTNEKVELLSDSFSSVGLGVESKYYIDSPNGFKKRFDNLDFYTERPKIMTFHSSKGLQFEHVILPMCEMSGGNYKMRDALYVALTRTSIDVFISYSRRLSTYLSRIPADLYDFRRII